MKLLGEYGDEKLYLFTPSFSRLFPVSGNMREMTLLQKIRFAMMLKSGYRIYVITDKDDNVEGSTVFSVGGSYRYPFSTKKDLIDGPNYTVPEYRGKGVATRLYDVIFEYYETDFDTVYATIANDNYPSLKRVKRGGYYEAYHVSAKRLTKKFCRDDGGNMTLVVYPNPRKNADGVRE